MHGADGGRSRCQKSIAVQLQTHEAKQTVRDTCKAKWRKCVCVCLHTEDEKVGKVEETG